jgi:hypothetical protein
MLCLDLFAGRFGWGSAFAERGWDVIGVDLMEPPEMPLGCEFVRADVLVIQAAADGRFFIEYEPGHELWSCYPDFVCASSPCEEFSIHGMKNFHPNPRHPEMGIRLFEHTRNICERSGVPYLMENVRPAQEFVGKAVHHCGPYYLWGSAVPLLVPCGIKKGFKLGNGKTARALKESGDRSDLIEYRKTMDCWDASKSKKRRASTAKWATIPPLLSACVADYAARICEERAAQIPRGA